MANGRGLCRYFEEQFENKKDQHGFVRQGDLVVVDDRGGEGAVWRAEGPWWVAWLRQGTARLRGRQAELKWATAQRTQNSRGANRTPADGGASGNENTDGARD
jgi:hypothetical protein